ncbi:MAG: carbohydrate-binding protein [Phycisphaerae bacterium]
MRVWLRTGHHLTGPRPHRALSRKACSGLAGVPTHFHLEPLERQELLSGTAPALPDGVHATGASSSSIQITWNDNATDETGYEIQAAALNWGPWSTIATVGANITSFTETGLTPGATFQYRIRALGTDLNSDWSGGNPAFATTLTSHDAQHVVPVSTYQDSNGGFYDFQAGLAVWQDQTWYKFTTFNFSNSAITSFSAVASGSSTGDSLEVHLDSPGGTLLGTLSIPATTDYNTYKNTTIALAAATGIHDVYVVYRTAAWQSHNLSAYSFGPDQAPVNTVPAAQVVGKNGSLVFSTANSNLISLNDPDAGANPLQVSLSVSNGTLTLGQTANLTFSVGDGTADAAMTFTGTLYDLQAALAGLQYTPAADFTGADLLTITSNDQGFIGSGGAQSDTDTIALNVQTVYVPPPTAPSAPTINATATSVTLGWTDTSSAEAGFQVQRSSGGYVNDWATVATLGANVTTFTDNSVSPGTAYKYRVRAYNSSGNSAYTDDRAAVVTTSYPHSLTTPWALTNYQQTTNTGQNWGSGMVVTVGGAWFRYSTFDFSSATATALTITSEGPMAGNILEVHLDSPSGTLIGSVSLNQGGDYSTVVSSTGTILPTTGIHDVYLVYRDAVGWGNILCGASFGVNQPPVNTVPSRQVLLKNTPLVFSSANGNRISFTDSDNLATQAAVTLTATHGTISLAQPTGLTFVTGTGTSDSIVTFKGTPDALNTAMNGLTFTPDTDYLGAATVTITTNDLGFVGSGGSRSATNSVPVQVLAEFDALGTPSDAQAQALSTSSIGLTWTNNATNADTFEIQRALWGTTEWQSVATVNAATTSYTDAGLASGATYQYRIRAANDSGWSSWNNGTTFATTRVPHSALGSYGTDQFQAASGPITGFLGGTGSFADGEWIMFNDFDFSAPVSAFTIKLATPQNPGHLQIRLDAPNGPQIGDLSISSTGSYTAFQSETARILATSGIHDLYLIFDIGNSSPSFLGFTFASNQPPVNSVPVAQRIPEDRTLTFSPEDGNPVTVSDPDAGNDPVQVTLKVTHGTLTLSTLDGLTFAQGTGAGDRTMTFSGAIWQINQALDGLTYTPDLHFVGDDSLIVTTDDLGNNGAGGPQQSSTNVAISVAAAVTPPTLATKASAGVPSDNTAPLNVLGADQDGEQVLTYTWTVLRGPAGAHVLFSQNASNSAKQTLVTVDQPGIYTFQVVISDGQSIVTSAVTAKFAYNVIVSSPPSGPPSSGPAQPTSGPGNESPSAPPSPPQSSPSNGKGEGSAGVDHTAGARAGSAPVTAHVAAAASAAPGGDSAAPRSSGPESSSSPISRGASTPTVAAPNSSGASAGNGSTAEFSDAAAARSAAGAITPADLARVPEPQTGAAAAKRLTDLVTEAENITVAPEDVPEALAADIAKDKKQIEDKQRDVQHVVGTIVGVSATATSACIIWIARGGSLLLSMLTSAPMWRYIDPLPVLNSQTTPKARKRWWQRRWHASNTPQMDATDQKVEQLVD